jgi:hypothetical protein
MEPGGVNRMHALEAALLYKQKATAKAREPGSVRLEPSKTGRAPVFLSFCVLAPIDKMLNFERVPLQLKWVTLSSCMDGIIIVLCAGTSSCPFTV